MTFLGQPKDVRRLVFLDETPLSRGQVLDEDQHGATLRQGAEGTATDRSGALWSPWRTTTFNAGLRDHGIVTQMVLNCAINGRASLAYVEQFLAPTLTPGDIVLADNLASHKVASVREAVEARAPN